ncbi:hypothetical protein [Deinococcus peraridilitoris]|uniref:hypothetical protein n=1 Tax=Deinococcus peraridilitoris TaxID=432329 RepID=UPI0003162C7D|nr:hypothetical protein [Deinococcus peraridilitoris]
MSGARTWPPHYFTIVLSAGFVVLAFSMNGPPLLALAFGGLGSLYLSMSLYLIVRDQRIGSRVDPDRRTLHWWVDFPPVQEQTIALADIAVIILDESSDAPRVRALPCWASRGVPEGDDVLRTQVEDDGATVNLR